MNGVQQMHKEAQGSQEAFIGSLKSIMHELSDKLNDTLKKSSTQLNATLENNSKSIRATMKYKILFNMDP